MVLTKNQILTFLNNKKNDVAKGSLKYYTIGALHLLVFKDAITAAEVVVEFPELA